MHISMNALSYLFFCLFVFYDPHFYKSQMWFFFYYHHWQTGHDISHNYLVFTFMVCFFGLGTSHQPPSFEMFLSGLRLASVKIVFILGDISSPEKHSQQLTCHNARFLKTNSDPCKIVIIESVKCISEPN